MAVGTVSYLGSELYVTSIDAEKPTEADKISYWRSVSGIRGITKEAIEAECTDGDGYSFWTTGKRAQQETVVDVNYIDKNGIAILDEFAEASGQDEVCKIWFKPTNLIGDETIRGFCSTAIITDRAERTADSSTAQGASYTFKKSGKPLKWDGLVG